jgi:SAM-dependent methyltransferase
VAEGSKLDKHLGKAAYSVRLLRYWWAGQALGEEASRLGRPLTVVDLGCERGWLKLFTPADAVERWIGLDWNPLPDARDAGYDEIQHANFDEPLPLSSGAADAVVSLHVFEHLPRPGATMAEVARVLREGAIFLGGAPTMPDPLARMRERYFRRQLEAGKILPGRHIAVLSPRRWKNLAHENGLEWEFATGSHAVRMTGSALESQRWWVRLNQIWGGLFPSLGSECYIQARRRRAWDHEAVPFPKFAKRPRLAWAGAAVLALLLSGLGVKAVLERGPGSRWHLGGPRCPVNEWLDAHRSEMGLFFAVEDPDLPALVRQRKDVVVVGTIEEALEALAERPATHLLVEFSDLGELDLGESPLGQFGIDSRLDLGAVDFFLLRPLGSNDSRLENYLRGS